VSQRQRSALLLATTLRSSLPSTDFALKARVTAGATILLAAPRAILRDPAFAPAMAARLRLRREGMLGEGRAEGG
jgi:hypothetical protein